MWRRGKRVTKKVLVPGTTTERSRLKRWTTIGEVKEIQKCCDGYIQEIVNGEISCKPICKSDCPNGYCVKPEVCACEAGYTKRNGICMPECLPNTCLCDFGYNLVNGTCLPACTKPCDNGICVAPDTCECNDGYFKSTTSCQPLCTGGCPLHSYCDAPEICKCNPGFQINFLSHYGCVCEYMIRWRVCEPRCKNCTVPICKNCIDIDWLPGSNEDTTTTTRNPLKLADKITSTTTPTTTYTTTSTTTSTIIPTTTSTTTPTTTPTTTSTTTTSTTTTPYLVSSTSSTEEVFYNNDTSTDLTEKSWMQRNGMFIWLPILLTLLIIGLILLRTPIINYFKGVKNRRNYNVKVAFRKQMAKSDPVGSQFPPGEREAQV